MKKPQRDAEGCYHRTAYVTVTIPVGLIGDMPLHNVRKWVMAALENFVDHPAISGFEKHGHCITRAHLEDLRGYMDKIVFEEEEAK